MELPTTWVTFAERRMRASGCEENRMAIWLAASPPDRFGASPRCAAPDRRYGARFRPPGLTQ